MPTVLFSSGALTALFAVCVCTRMSAFFFFFSGWLFGEERSRLDRLDLFRPCRIPLDEEGAQAADFSHKEALPAVCDVSWGVCSCLPLSLREKAVLLRRSHLHTRTYAVFYFTAAAALHLPLGLVRQVGSLVFSPFSTTRSPHPPVSHAHAGVSMQVRGDITITLTRSNLKRKQNKTVAGMRARAKILHAKSAR